MKNQLFSVNNFSPMKELSPRASLQTTKDLLGEPLRVLWMYEKYIYLFLWSSFLETQTAVNASSAKNVAYL